MKLERALVLLLALDFALAIIEKTIDAGFSEATPYLKGLRALLVLLSIVVFLAWVSKTFSALMNGPERALREAERQRISEQTEAEQAQQAAVEEERRLRRNARQRERRAERRAQEASEELARIARRNNAVRPKPDPKKEAPVATGEPKSRWDRLLEDDEE